MNDVEGITICAAGLFHYRNYAGYLQKLGALNHIYFSHKVGQLPEIDRNRRTNLPLKEYLMTAHIRLFGAVSAFRKMRMYNWFWQAQCRLSFKPGKRNLVLLQGNGHAALRSIRRKGGIAIGEVVNAHPTLMNTLLSNDAKLHGVQHFWTQGIIDDKLSELELVDYLLSPSQFVTNSYIDNGFPASRILTIPYGVGSLSSTIPKTVKNVGKSSDEKIKVISVGQVFPRKGQYHLLKAIMHHGSADDFEITLIGLSDPNYMKALQQLGVPFRHIERLPHADVLGEISRSDVLCLSSLEDGFGMVVAEALSMNTPVAVSSNAGASELVRRCGGGIIFDPTDYLSLITSLRQCKLGVFPSFSFQPTTWKDYAQLVRSQLNALEKPEI
ncbi:MAG: glycosyltransferase family 4 protein [Polynucleobacter sp.]|nr:glycosyltransferase family 4 protein [Polynucleobacter sp.]